MVSLHMYLKPFLVESMRVMAITEDENEISLRDANASRERPRLEGFDMDSDIVQEIEVYLACVLSLLAIQGGILFQR